MTTATQAVANPFPGLRSFESRDTDLFFGREEQVDELVGWLANYRLIAVVGTSGSGKSSLVRAGLLPALEGGYLTGVGSGWRLAVMKPGYHPMESLGQSLVEVVGGQREMVQAGLRRSSRGLIEAIREARLPAADNFLLVVDQFEEVFTQFDAAINQRGLTRQEARDDYSAFVRLLIEATWQTEIPIYVVITMRSDFLGACSEFTGLPEALNGAQYLVPRMSREQLRQAIAGPVAVSGGAIAPRLVQQLLNEIIDDQDQLPVLQHALMRPGPDGATIPLTRARSICGITSRWTMHCPTTLKRPSPNWTGAVSGSESGSSGALCSRTAPDAGSAGRRRLPSLRRWRSALRRT
jgi:hypothetical protein